MKDTRASKRQFIVYTETAKMVITIFLAVVFILGLGDACSWIPKVEQQDFCSAHYGKYYSFILRFIPIMRNNLTATIRQKLIVKNKQNVSSFIIKKIFYFGFSIWSWNIGKKIRRWNDWLCVRHSGEGCFQGVCLIIFWSIQFIAFSLRFQALFISMFKTF